MAYDRHNKTGGNSNKKYAKRDPGGSYGDSSRVKPVMHRAICSDCDKECEVPFKPSNDKPVFCRNCFKDKEGSPSPKFRMHSAICSKCGNDCEVPFKPSGEKPIYCDQCFTKSTGKLSNKRSDKISDKNSYKKQSGVSSNTTDEQFEILNSKLDKILSMLNSAE